MNQGSVGENQYFVLFIDDETRMTWCCFLKQKSEVFQVFKKFKLMVETHSGLKIKCWRIDNGSEYTSQDFRVLFLQNNGIVHHLTVPYSP